MNNKFDLADIQAGIALMQKVSWDQAMWDASAAMEAVSHAGKVGMRRRVYHHEVSGKMASRARAKTTSPRFRSTPATTRAGSW